MLRTSQLLREGRATGLLALPLMAGQVSQMLMGLTDTLMIGRLGVVPLAASTFANSLLWVPFMLVIGMTIAVSVRVSQALGANKPADSRAALRHGLYLSLIVGCFTLLLAFAITPALPWFRQSPEVVAAAEVYFILVAASMIPVAGTMAIKSFADALNRPWPVFWLMLGGVLLNIGLNWIFIFGNLGAPAMGLEGAGLATLLARIFTLVIVFIWCLRLKSLKEWVPVHWLRAPDWTAMRNMVSIGLPASMQLLAECSAFVAATIMIGTLGPASLASHQIAIQCAATIFMIPLGLSMAVTVRIGEAYGARAQDRLRPIAISAWIMVIGFTLVSATSFLLFNDTMAGWFVQEPVARALTAQLIHVAAAFQLADAFQILSAGGLRGLNDVKIPAWIAFLAYWVISLPLGWWLAFRMDIGAAGMWWGITLGLCVTAVWLSLRLWKFTGREIPEPEEEAETPLAEVEVAS